jgi:type III secretion system YscJ/HrcJ family lipoprotein
VVKTLHRYIKNTDFQYAGFKYTGGFLVTLCLLVSQFLLSGCGSEIELHSKLDAEQSVEVLVALNRAGIQASRARTSSGRNESYSVSVPSANYQSALEVLHEYGLPGKQRDSVNEMLSPQGLFPSSPELSGLRVDHVLALEIERLLEGMPGIASAKVIVRSRSLQGQRRIFGNTENSSVSLLIRYSAVGKSQLPFSVEEVKKIVMKAVPNLVEDNISISASKINVGSLFSDDALTNGQLRKVSPFAFRVPQQDYMRAKYQLVGILLLICFAGILLGSVVGAILMRRSIVRRINSAAFNEGSLFLEASVESNSGNQEKLLPEGRDNA